MAKNFGKSAAKFFLGLDPGFKLPAGIEVLMPYDKPEVKRAVRHFFDRFYDDNHTRKFLLGINPGRFGAGATGIAFTDPLRLENDCGIKNDLPKKPELSSDFIYQMIGHLGGPTKFYNEFFITAVCPVGFTSGGKNLNYYDDARLQQSALSFISDSIRKQISFGADTRTAFCIGEGKNYQFLKKLNDDEHFFETIVPMPHPRFIMQYRRKSIWTYLDIYKQALTAA